MNKETFIRDGNNLLKVLYSETLDILLQHCIDDYFPELKKKNIKIGHIISLNDVVGGVKAGDWVILFLPDIIKVEHPANKWIVVHELCHFINLHNPDAIFKEKVPKNVWEVWKRLEKVKELVCDEGWARQRKPEVIGKINQAN
ncbi:MAG: hypothetical protein MUP69_10395 [Candidatus Atribacteria bacterium]|nr:hypothetical protein [Candidatus Atribacteria bacterium]